MSKDLVWRNTLTIHKDRSTFPIGADQYGRVDLESRQDYHYVYSEDLCQLVSGIPFLRISTDLKLSAEEVMYLMSRVRGDDYIDPCGSHICIWLNKYGGRGRRGQLAIGLSQIDINFKDGPSGREDFADIINKMLLGDYNER